MNFRGCLTPPRDAIVYQYRAFNAVDFLKFSKIFRLEVFLSLNARVNRGAVFARPG